MRFLHLVLLFTGCCGSGSGSLVSLCLLGDLIVLAGELTPYRVKCTSHAHIRATTNYVVARICVGTTFGRDSRMRNQFSPG
ncbi:hypothetical protein PR001_g24492 [Phytophthora rubi]|uniref:Secreted protein n=1 Tax=Phytophthora rubi TaxID=129364 RepID=A0A6A3IGP9_9STRA|nr:hypothetical protein PR001_g24492 [Phytophthora rubi]